MSKINIASVLLYSKRAEIRDVIRQAFKAQGLASSQQHNIFNEREMLQKIKEEDYAFLVLDWELGADSIQRILAANRRDNRLESHPTFLIAAKEKEEILALAREYYISYVSIGEVNTDTIREQTAGLVWEYQNLSPVRQVLLNVHHARKQGNARSAHEMLVQLVQKSRDNPRVVVELAESYIQRNEWEQAEQLLRPFVNLEPPYARIKHLYARCRLKKQDYNGAIASLKGAQLVSPYNLERLLEMGELFLDLDRLDEAMAAFDDILQFAPAAKEAKWGKSQTLMLAGELNEALAILRESSSKQELSAVFNTSAIIATRQNKYELGFRLYRKAMQLLREEKKLISRVIYNLGIGLVKFGQPEKGLICFEKSFELDKTFGNAGHNVKVLKQHLKQPHDKEIIAPIDDTEEALEQSILADLDSAEATVPADFTEDDPGSSQDMALDHLIDEVEDVC